MSQSQLTFLPKIRFLLSLVTVLADIFKRLKNIGELDPYLDYMFMGCPHKVYRWKLTSVASAIRLCLSLATPLDGSFVTAIGDILKISPMTVTKESLDRVHCCHSHH